MGALLDRLLGVTPAMVTAAAVVDAPVGTVATTEGALSALDPVAAAAFGIPTDDSGPVTRLHAMRVPGIRRGRNLIAGTIGTLPLVAERRDGTPVPTDHPTSTLLRQLDPRTTPAYTIAWTVDDLLFRGVAWWRVTTRDLATSYPTAVERLAPERVQVQLPTADKLGRVYVDGKEAADRDLIRFDGTDDGLLCDGGPTVRLALALQRAAKRVADDDWSGMILRLADGSPELDVRKGSAGDGTDRSQVDLLLDSFQAAIAARTTPYMNGAVVADNVGVNAQQRQLNEMSQLVSSELARLLNLPASRIGAPQGSGMTYSNTESDRRDLVDTTLAPYLTTISQRLSLGDVTPYPQAVRFDLTAYLRGTTGELVSAGAAAIQAGLTDAPEVRTRWLGLPPRSDLPTPTEGNPA